MSARFLQMRAFRSSVGATVAALMVSAAVHAATAHVHGKAKLDVSVDGGTLTVDFASPLDNLVGFEHAPRNAKQEAAVRRMAERLHKAETLFVPAAEARCTRESLTMQSPVIAPALLSPPGAPASSGPPPAKTDSTHAELDLTLVFRCAHPEKLNALDVVLFEAFPHVKRIEARVAAGRKQAGSELTARKRRLTW